MSEPTDLLFALRDVGLSEPRWGHIDARVGAGLEREVARGARRLRGVKRRPRARLLLAVAVLLTTATAGAAVSGLVGPEHLFRTNPAGEVGAGSQRPWHQTVIPSSVRRLEVINVPGTGDVEYWTARTTQNGICGALRLPGGGWAGLPQRGGPAAGGTVPGCYPTRRQIDGSGPGPLLVDGFDYADAYIRDRGGRTWLIEYGVLDAPGSAIRVRDVLGGAAARVLDGRYFAIVVGTAGASGTPRFRLAALDAAGRVLLEEPVPPVISLPPAAPARR